MDNSFRKHSNSNDLTGNNHQQDHQVTNEQYIDFSQQQAAAAAEANFQNSGNYLIANNNNPSELNTTHEVAAIAALDASMADMEPWGGVWE